jgi:hypothetical protein
MIIDIMGQFDPFHRRATVAPGAVPRLPPLHPGQALALWLFQPVRPGVGTDDATAGEGG